jgi:hypothetical protein
MKRGKGDEGTRETNKYRYTTAPFFVWVTPPFFWSCLGIKHPRCGLSTPKWGRAITQSCMEIHPMLMLWREKGNLAFMLGRLNLHTSATPLLGHPNVPIITPRASSACPTSLPAHLQLHVDKLLSCTCKQGWPGCHSHSLVLAALLPFSHPILLQQIKRCKMIKLTT